MAQSDEVLMSIPSKNPENLSHNNVFTAASQQCTPYSPQETLPGGFYQYNPSMIVELFPYSGLFFGETKVHSDSFFCSYRSLYGDEWYKWFLLDKLKMPSVDLSMVWGANTPPPAEMTNQAWKLFDMLGYPVAVRNSSAANYPCPINPTKFFMYWRIMRDYYMDPVLDEELINIFDGFFELLNVSCITYAETSNSLSYFMYLGDSQTVQDFFDAQCSSVFISIIDYIVNNQSYISTFQRRIKKDYFTTLLPNLQFGEPMRVPVEGPFIDSASGDRYAVGYQGQTTSDGHAAISAGKAGGTSGITSGQNAYVLGGTIRDLQRLESVQRFLERLNFAGGNGANIKDLSEAIFGESPDAVSLNRSFWIDSFSRDVMLSEVVQTSNNENDSDPLGTKTANGIVASKGPQFSIFTKEHGYIMHIFTLMPSVYYAYCPRDSFKRNLQDYYLPDLAFIGEQEVLGRELITEGNGQTADPDTGLFPQEDLIGYQPRYDEYRHRPNELHGAFRTSQLQYMIHGRVFDDKVNLNSDFIVYPNERFNQMFSYVNPQADTCMVKVGLRCFAEIPVVDNPTRV